MRKTIDELRSERNKILGYVAEHGSGKTEYVNPRKDLKKIHKRVMKLNKKKKR